MSDTIAISRIPTTVGRQFVEQLDRLLVALTETEHHAATILAFDPDAHVTAGQLAAADDEPRDRLLRGDAMNFRAWSILAWACSPEAHHLDDISRLAHFLAERTGSAEAVLEPAIGVRVRIRARQRIGGDRYAGREGVIVKSHFVGFYVKLDMTARERSQKTELVETAYLEILAPAAAD